LDEDEKPLLAALRSGGCEASPVEWDDAQVSWASFELVLLRSTWDYAERLPEFLDWVEPASPLTRVLNPAPVVRWNTDKHYLGELGRVVRNGRNYAAHARRR
jgi:O-ureido-D-serine cyclo-ligase